MDSLQQVHIILMLGVLDLNAALQMGSHENGVEEENQLPQPASDSRYCCKSEEILPGLISKSLQLEDRIIKVL